MQRRQSSDINMFIEAMPRLVQKHISRIKWLKSNSIFFLSDEGPMLETLDYTIRIGSIPTFLYFDFYPPLFILSGAHVPRV